MTPDVPRVIDAEVAIPHDIGFWAVREVMKHREEWGLQGDEGLSVRGPLCAIEGSVPEHVDRDYLTGDVIVGLIFQSGGHVLHVAGGSPPMPLKAGDIYVLDPGIKHAALTDKPDGVLIFAAIEMQRHRILRRVVMDRARCGPISLSANPVEPSEMIHYSTEFDRDFLAKSMLDAVRAEMRFDGSDTLAREEAYRSLRATHHRYAMETRA